MYAIRSYYVGFGDDLKIVSSSETWNRFGFAALLELRHELSLLDAKVPLEHKKYTQQGMIKRVLHERMQKALVAKYKVTYAKNKYGDHIVTNENGVKYKVFLRDFENETGYSNSKDSALNKLGTTKHRITSYNVCYTKLLRGGSQIITTGYAETNMSKIQFESKSQRLVVV